MEKRSVQEIAQDLKWSLAKLLEATKRVDQAERDRTRAIVEILNLQKELERDALD